MEPRPPSKIRAPENRIKDRCHCWQKVFCQETAENLGLARVTVDSLKEMNGSTLNKFLLSQDCRSFIPRTIVQISLRYFCIWNCWIKRHKLCPEKTKNTITHECYFYLGSVLHVRQKS